MPSFVDPLVGKTLHHSGGVFGAQVITSKDQLLTKAHIRFLESRLITIASTAGRAVIANGNAPPIKPLPEADISDMENFLAQLNVLLPVLGFDFLRLKPRPVSSSSQNTTQTDEAPAPVGAIQLVYENNRHGLKAEAIEKDGEITVLKGSKALNHEFATNTYGKLRQQLIDEGKLIQTDDPSFLISKPSVLTVRPSPSS